MIRLYQWLMMISLSMLTANLLALDTTIEIPGSLGKWYKPDNKRQVWLHTMFGMRRELQAIEEYSYQGDLEGIKKWSAKLIKHYRRLPEMVPEWLDEVELDTAEDLEKAVEQGDLSKIKSTTKKLSRSCRGCHSDFRVLARLRYRTADFKPLKIIEQGNEVSFHDFKKDLIKTLNRIKISAVDSRWEKAAVAVDKLESKLQDYAVVCASCHKDKQPRERILGAATQQGLNKLKQAVISKDLKLTGRSLGSTAVDVCARCHGVHRTLSEIRGQLFTD